jgi:hypothetical protein
MHDRQSDNMADGRCLAHLRCECGGSALHRVCSRKSPMYHKRTVLSRLPETTYLPSGVTATLLTPLSCPVNRRTSCPVARSHKRTVKSPLPETTYWPSGVTATLQTGMVVPREPPHFLPRRQLPQTHRFVHASRNDVSAIGRHREATDPALVPREPPHFSASGHQVP